MDNATATPDHFLLNVSTVTGDTLLEFTDETRAHEAWDWFVADRASRSKPKELLNAYLLKNGDIVRKLVR